jgi:site-specific recombinase XerD
MRIEPLYEEFLTYLEVERDSSPLTITSYRSDGKLFVASLGHLGVEPQIDAVSGHVVRRYLAYLSRRGQKPASIARKLCSLRSFWRYLRDSDYTQSDPFVRISAPSKERALPNYLSAQECAALLDAAERQRSIFLAFRDKAALATLIFTGLRRGEILGLRVAALDFADNKVVVRRGKGKKSRVVPMVAQLRQPLEDWLEVRPACGHDFVFTTQSGVRMGKRGLMTALGRALATAGIDKPGITLHKLRHSFACMLLQNGCDLFSLSTMLGHTRLDTTAIYLEATVEHLRSAIGRQQQEG